MPGVSNRYSRYPDYKDSGVEWLGEIPEGWEVKKLKYVTELNKATLPENTNPEYKIKYVDINSVNIAGEIVAVQKINFGDAPSRARRIAKQKDVIISTVRTYLRAIAYIEFACDDLIVSTGFAVITPQAVLLPKLLYYIATSNYFVSKIMANSVGISYPAINSSDIHLLNIPLPPKQAQQQIADFLDTQTAKIDRLVNINEKKAALLKEYRQALISHAVTKGLDPNARMKDSGVEWFGKIPREWHMVRLDAALQERGELNIGPKTQNILSVLRERGVINYEDKGDIGNKKSEDIERYRIVHKGDIVINNMNIIIGSVGIAHEYGALSPVYYVLKSARQGISTKYFNYIFNTKSFQRSLVRIGFGILEHRMRIPFILLKMEKLPLPTYVEQKQIADFLDDKTGKIDAEIQQIQRQNELLKEYRQSLISNAVTGKIMV